MQNPSKEASRGPGLDARQREQFLDTGVVRLPGLIPKAAAEAMADRLWDTLASQHGAVRNRPETWTKQRPAQFRDLRRAGAFAGMASEALAAVLDDLFGKRGWTPPPHWGGPLVTFPRGGPSGPHSGPSAQKAATGSAASQMAWATAGSIAWSW